MPTRQIAADQIPAGKSSEEVIGAAITAGTTPCLIFNTAPAAVPQFQKAVGLVSLSDFSDGITAIESRSGDRASQYKSPDGKYYQMPWKTNPVMIFYNKDVFQKAGISDHRSTAQDVRRLPEHVGNAREQRRREGRDLALAHV